MQIRGVLAAVGTIPPRGGCYRHEMAAAPTRRNLRFNTIDDALAEAMRLAGAERDGHLLQLGNWALGQTLGHLATWANFALDGYPDAVRPPVVVRWVARLLRNRIITKGMMPGMKLRGVPGGTLGLEPLPTDEGLTRFQAALERLRTTPPTIVNPVFGPLTHDQWIQLNLRHAELHLGFFVAQNS
jgi:hypothetical protein